jgi:hypothetical protein
MPSHHKGKSSFSTFLTVIQEEHVIDLALLLFYVFGVYFKPGNNPFFQEKKNKQNYIIFLLHFLKKKENILLKEMRFDQSICFERWAAGVGRHVRIDFCVCLLGKKRDRISLAILYTQRLILKRAQFYFILSPYIRP